MAKKITGYLKLQVPAGAANPSPPIGPALGQRGLNIMEFCKEFNAASQEMEKGAPIPVVLTIYADRSFTFEMKTPPVSHFLKKAAGLQKGGQTPGRARCRPRDARAGAFDRRAEAQGPERPRYRCGDEDGRRLGSLHGS